MVHHVAASPRDPPRALLVRVLAPSSRNFREETLRESWHEKRHGARPAEAIGREQGVVPEEPIARVRGAQTNVRVDRIHRPPVQASKVHCSGGPAHDRLAPREVLEDAPADALNTVPRMRWHVHPGTADGNRDAGARGAPSDGPRVT